MNKILVTALLVLATVSGIAACKAETPETVDGAASDHSHVVSFDQFTRIARGAGQPSATLPQAYAITTSVCDTVMTSRWQDRPQLLSLLPASIQDPTLRTEVYYAVLGTDTAGKLTACVA